MSIRDRILARPDLNAMRAAGDIDGLAAALNADAPMVAKSRFVTARTVLAECPNGSAILDALVAAQSISAVAWALKFLAQDSGLDIGHPTTLGMVDQLVAGGALSATQGDALKALANAPELVTRLDVADAMYNPDGTEK
jgi:hypothetical protein